MVLGLSNGPLGVIPDFPPTCPWISERRRVARFDREDRDRGFHVGDGPEARALAGVGRYALVLQRKRGGQKPAR